MVALDSLIRIAEQVETAPVSLTRERCLHWRHKEAPCWRCLEACPTRAITLGEPIALDGERCVGCGLCQHICPTEAFQSSGDSENKLLQVMSSLDEGDLELACDHKADLSSARAKVSYVVSVKHCLASLSLPTLLTAAIRRKSNSSAEPASNIWLNDEPCQTCPRGGVQSEVRQMVALANRLLSAFGQSSRIYTYRGSPELLPRKPRSCPVVQGDGPHYSRRAFFGSLSRQTRRVLVNLAAENMAEKSAPTVEDKLPQQLPAGRRSLARILQRLGEPAVESIKADGLSLGTVSINGDCTACGLCARLCPSGALSFASNERRFAIAFAPIACLGCGICALICPSKAAAFEPRVNLRDLVAFTPHVLQSGRLVSCRLCGASCTGHDHEALCFVCHRRQGTNWPADQRGVSTTRFNGRQL